MPQRIAIDGFAGTGKSTAARNLATSMVLPYLNTGQLYRAVTYLAQQTHNFDPNNIELLVSIASELHPVIGTDGKVVSGCCEVLVDKLDSDKVSSFVATVAGHAGVREALVEVQRQFARQRGAVMEGRDIGTSIMPDADFKFFMVCDLDERVRRMHLGGSRITKESLMERDNKDMDREISPLLRADDAVQIDSTSLTPAGVLRFMLDHMRDKRAELEQNFRSHR